MPQFVLLWTDAALWLLVASLVIYSGYVRRRPHLAANWTKVFCSAPTLSAAVVLGACLLLTLADSVHFRAALPPVAAEAGSKPQAVAYAAQTQSLLDALLREVVRSREATYSRPLAYVGFTKETITVNGRPQRVAPRLLHGGAHLEDPATQWRADVLTRGIIGLAWGTLTTLVLCGVLVTLVSRRAGVRWVVGAGQMWRCQTRIPWRTACGTLAVLTMSGGVMVALMHGYHVFGTDVTGNDVLYQTLKSVRTAFVIGTLATLATLPLAVVLGIMAGYYKGWVDEVIQYIYTVLSSIPNILLIAACVLMVQVFLDAHPEWFETGAERADIKLFLLCAVLGLTGWAGLCRLLRGETLKLRELDYVQAATAFGVSHGRIMLRHIFPNVAHLMLIVTVLEFSGLILYEAVLSYVGVGVDPSMNSFGSMINFSRNEMGRDPLVWWPFAAAFFFLVMLVLAANLFADGVQQAFDPHARTFKPRLVQPPKPRKARP